MNETLTVETGLINLEESKHCREAHELYKQFKPDDMRRLDLPCFQTEIWNALPEADQNRCLQYWERNKMEQSSGAGTAASIEKTAAYQQQRNDVVALMDSLKEAV